MQSRIKYLDVAKCIGIFCIFLGHFGESAGLAYSFVFSFHVPLFFFLSGCTESIGSEMPWHQYIWKNVKNILIPFYIFAIASVMVQTVCNNTYTQIIPNLILVLKGCVRNRFFASGLWFLSCLFVVKMAFFVLRKALKWKALVLVACVALYCVAQLVITPAPIVKPHMLYNVDSACYYIIFYALGYYCFGMVRNLLNLDSTGKKAVCTVLGVISFGFAGTLFFGKNVLSVLGDHTVVQLVTAVLGPMLVIVGVMILSKIMESADLLVNIGKDTLFLCGSEYIVKLLVSICLQTVGLKIVLSNPIAAYLYTFALLVLCHKVLVPIEKGVFKKLGLLSGKKI